MQLLHNHTYQFIGAPFFGCFLHGTRFQTACWQHAWPVLNMPPEICQALCIPSGGQTIKGTPSQHLHSLSGYPARAWHSGRRCEEMRPLLHLLLLLPLLRQHFVRQLFAVARPAHGNVQSAQWGSAPGSNAAAKKVAICHEAGDTREASWSFNCARQKTDQIDHPDAPMESPPEHAMPPPPNPGRNNHPMTSHILILASGLCLSPIHCTYGSLVNSH